jgi:methyltransferase (TIGR00027 family)
MKPHRASRTAEGAATFRAAGARDRRFVVPNPDRLAERLLSWKNRMLVRVPPLRSTAQLLVERALPGMQAFHLARTRHFDALVAGEVEAGVGQLVVLGAGLDTRAYRIPGLGALHLFEVDHPATQTMKRARLRTSGVASAHVTYVPVDFERHSLEERLLAARFDPASPACFLWEGVTMYLSTEAVDAMLAFVARAARRSSIAFDYMFRDAIAHPDRYPGVPEQVRLVTRAGEPYVFGIDPNGAEAFLAERGLILASQVLPDELATLYLARRDGGRTFLPAAFAIAHARAGG